MSERAEAGLTIIAYTADLWEHVCPVIRLVHPAEMSGCRLIRGCEWIEGQFWVYPERMSNADLVILQRNFPGHVAEYEQVVEQARALGKPIIFELDDNLLELPEEHPDYDHYLVTRTAILRAVVEVDAVVASTPTLCDYLRAFNPVAQVFPNYLNDRLWRLKPPTLRDRGVIRIGYMGGHSHSYDLQIVVPALEKTLRRYGSRVAVRFWGLAPPAEIRDRANVDWIDVGLVDYGEFAAYFLDQECDLFIAPLQDNLFNHCKSHLKFLEYSALGVAGVYSRVTPYERVIEHGVNGFLASSTEEWEQYLAELIENADLRYQMGMQAQQEVRANWLLSDHAHEWAEMYRSLCQKRPRPVKDVIAKNVALKSHLWQHGLECRSAEQGRKERHLREQLTMAQLNIQQLEQTIIEKEHIIVEKEQSLNEMDQTIQHIYSLYADILNSTSWRILQRIQKVRQYIFPSNGFLERLLRFAMRGVHILKNEGVRPFLKSLSQFGLSVFRSEQIAPSTSRQDSQEVMPKTLIAAGLPCSYPAISIVWLKDDLDVGWNEQALLSWARTQTCAQALEVVVWERHTGVAYRLGQAQERLEAKGMAPFLSSLNGRYLCFASDDLLSHPTTYLESNLIALESESLAFTINLRGYCDWALQRLRQGYLPGNANSPLLRQVWRKEYVRDDFSIDLSTWLGERRGFPGVAGKVIIHTTNLVDTESSLPFEQRLDGGDWALHGRYLLLRSKNELPWQSTAHTLCPVDTVLRANPNKVTPGSMESYELPTVIMVMPFLAVGGAERLAINTIRYLKDKIRFVVVSLEPLDRSLGTTADEFHQVASATYQFADFLDAHLNFSLMSYLIEKYQPQALYIANGATWIYNALNEIKQKYPSLRIVNQVYDHRVGWINRYDLSLVMNIDAHIAPNQNIYKAYVDLGVHPQNIYFIEHGIDPEEVNPARYSQQSKQVIKHRLGLPGDKKVVAFVARLHPQKRPMDFIELARRFASDSGVFFLMVGDGPLAKRVEAEIIRLGLNNIQRLPFYRPASDIYAVADVLVLPSEYEAMPLVVAEAQAMGKPVVVTDVGNNREVVEMTGGGVVVPRVGDIAALMEGVRRMLEHPPDPDQVRQAILARFGIEVIAEQYRKVLLGEEDA